MIFHMIQSLNVYPPVFIFCVADALNQDVGMDMSASTHLLWYARTFRIQGTAPKDLYAMSGMFMNALVGLIQVSVLINVVVCLM